MTKLDNKLTLLGQKHLHVRKRKVYFAIYRIFRKDMVARMKANGFTWTKINGVLRILGQKQIVRVEYTNSGMKLTFAHVALKENLDKVGGRWQKVYREPVPEVLNHKHMSNEH